MPSAVISGAVSLIEGIISTVATLVVLYLTILKYRYNVTSIIGINILLGVFISLVHHLTVSSDYVTMSSLTSGVFAEGFVMAGVGIISIVLSFVIAMQRFSFLQSLGIFVAGALSVGIINTLLGLYRTPSASPKQTKTQMKPRN